MKKIGKFVKRNIIGFVTGFIIAGTIGVYAATIAASNVTFTSTTGLTSTTAQGAIDEAYQNVRKIKQGDYIRLTPTASTYSISKSATGYSSAQTIKPKELTLWRVISVGTDGIEVVSDQVSSTNVFFGTKLSTSSTITADKVNVVACRMFIKTLNTIAAQYTDGVHVKATRHMGYDNNLATEEITDTTSLISTTSPWTCSTSKDCNASQSLGGGDLGYIRDYDMVVKVYGSAIANQYNTTTATKYWLASRSYNYSGSSGWGFSGRSVSTSGSVDTGGFYGRASTGFYYNTNSKAIRPILTLNPDITISGGSGKSGDPYTLA